MNPLILILIVAFGGMLLMTRSQKNKQRQVLEMREKMEPGAGIRTIGGMYAVVKEVNQETVLLELTDGVHAHFTKGAISAVLSEQEFNRIVHGIEPEELDDADTADADGTDASDVTDADGAEDTAQVGAHGDADVTAADGDRVELKKTEAEPEAGGSGPAK
ncbi:preprotein translocase subunit YajC [Streptomyces sp. NRRL F-5123]|uniref:preprotein translocase subunit YajC n=1 Tax=Streptomyces sp. NRRL F-5123 TaxID=1463856 RepID=UPI0005BAC001|nr:preprotein translocase subunit YajC [Streptomyces sp. NRRL F-5123]